MAGVEADLTVVKRAAFGGEGSLHERLVRLGSTVAYVGPSSVAVSMTVVAGVAVTCVVWGPWVMWTPVATRARTMVFSPDWPTETSRGGDGLSGPEEASWKAAPWILVVRAVAGLRRPCPHVANANPLRLEGRRPCMSVDSL